MNGLCKECGYFGFSSRLNTIERQFTVTIALLFHDSSRTSTPPHLSPLLSFAQVRRSTPVLLAPVCSTTEIFSCTAEVGSRAAQSSLALLVDNRPASLALTRIRTPCYSWLGRCLLAIALSITSLATITAVEALVLDVVLRSAVAGRRAAPVEVTVGSRAGAGHTTLSVATDIDDRNRGRECLSRRGAGLGSGLHGGGGLGGARGSRSREGLQAGGSVAVVLGATAL